jgi:two-component system, NarL family, nitrate/nitrite response regulator NarL
MSETKHRLLIVDDHTLVRVGLAEVLAKQPDLEVVAACGSVAEGLEILQREPVDVVLLDYYLGPESGSAFIAGARAAGYEGKILIVSGGLSDTEAVEVIRQGVSGIFLKQGSPELLAKAIRKVMEGEIWLDQRHLALFMRSVTLPAEGSSPRLTQREAAVLKRIAEGRANKEIATELGVTEGAVKATVQQLFRKHGVRNRGQLVRVALEQYPRLG